MNYCALASGSNGNCYYIAKGDDAILIDIGINTKHVLLRMANIGIDPASIKAIFITHEHGDHIRGLSVFAKRYQVPVYITAGSYKGSRLHMPEHLIHTIEPNAKTSIGELTIYGVPKYHDAKEPCSFIVSDGLTNIGIVTDIGKVCDNVKRVIRNADVLLLESNYDEEMLENGRYSYYLKNRIRGGLGHISNKQALAAFLENKTDRLRHLILGHLSGQNNTVELVQNLFEPHCANILFSVATRYQETDLFQIARPGKHVNIAIRKTSIIYQETTVIIQ